MRKSPGLTRTLVGFCLHAAAPRSCLRSRLPARLARLPLQSGVLGAQRVRRGPDSQPCGEITVQSPRISPFMRPPLHLLPHRHHHQLCRAAEGYPIRRAFANNSLCSVKLSGFGVFFFFFFALAIGQAENPWSGNAIKEPIFK